MTMISAKPTLPEFPDFFETERLLLRAPRAGDGRVVNDAIRESHESLRPWMPWARTIPSVAESETFAREGALHFRIREELPLLLFRKSDGLFVGASGMHSIDWKVPRFEIGYWVRVGLAGQGYITEAVRGIAQFAFARLGAVRLEIRCDARNERSAAVALRAGFTFEARHHHDARDNDGDLRDTLVFVRFPDSPGEI